MVIETVVEVGVIVFSTINVALWAFRPNLFSTDPRARRWTEIITVAWVIFLPASGAAALALGSSTWQGVVTGAVALACWPVTILALRKRRVSRAAQQEADRQADDQLLTLLDERSRAEVNDLLAGGKVILAVRRVRELTGLRLPAAKRLVDLLQR
jgi:hypothetical protein